MQDFVHMVLFTLFFPVNFTWLLRKWICQRFLIKPQGVNIIQFILAPFLQASAAGMFFYFEAGASEKLSASQVFQSDLL